MCKLFMLAAALTLALGGCANLKQDYDLLTGASVTPTSIYIAANAFDAVEKTAAVYLRLPACAGTGLAVCRTQSAVNAIVPAVRSGRAVRKQLEAAVFQPNGAAPTPASALSILETSTATIRQILANYNVQVTQ